jgi:hypothetical protein
MLARVVISAMLAKGATVRCVLPAMQIIKFRS